MEKTIIHCDMDAFFAAVEVRDDPSLKGKPLIIGALPDERGVVSTCSYEARKYGVRSAMSIKEAFRLCPEGIYIHPNMNKYVKASAEIHEVWNKYTDLIEYVSLDEGYLDVTGSLKLFGTAQHIGREIKTGILERTGLTCSVGIGYSMMSAKIASEEKKPDGFFVIPTPQKLRSLIIDRNVRVIYGVGPQTAAALEKIGVSRVRDIYDNRAAVIKLLGEQGRQIAELADGTDNRNITPHIKAQSSGKEHTFQRDITDFYYLEDVLRLIARDLSYEMRLNGMFCRTVTLKVTYSDMKKITRSKSGEPLSKAVDIYRTVAQLLDKIEKRPVRLIGITLSGFTGSPQKQLSLLQPETDEKEKRAGLAMLSLQRKYGPDIIKTGSEFISEKRIKKEKSDGPDVDL